MTPLPIDRFIPEVIARLRESRSLVLVAPPGAGKTTRVPPAVLLAGLLGTEHPNLVMLQPRRVAARAAAMRIAEEQGWELGREAGYHVRFDRKIGPDTRCRVLTEGILTRQLLDDPFLEGVGAVLLDEFHERSLHTDLAIALLREVRQTVRDDLILLVMSATLAAEPVAAFLGGCPIVRAEGRTFPVELEHAAAPAQGPLPDRIASAVAGVLSQRSGLGVPPERARRAAPAESLGRDAQATEAAGNDPGDVLVFLPGADEIRRSASALEPLAARHDLLVLPLHGSLPAEDQIRALRPANQRKVILATNIAETSLTIDGVRTVIDSGLARVAGHDAERGLDRLELQRISKASATQRAGRAGRTAPGRAIRLWTAKEHQALADFDVPEVRRVDLAGTVLSLHAWGHTDPRKFPWFEPPDEDSLVSAERLLAMLGALTGETDGRLTPLGKQLVALPLHPRLARLLLVTADAGMIDEGAALAALLSEKDLVAYDDFASRRGGPKVQGPSDLLVRLDLLHEAERDRFGRHLLDRGIDPVAARQVARTRDELYRVASRISGVRRGPSQAARDDGALLKALLAAYPDRVCRRRASDPSAAAMAGGGGVRLARESVVWQPEFFLALDARRDQRSTAREALVRIASGIDVAWLDELFPQSIRRAREPVFDEQRQRIVGKVSTFYRDLLLREENTGSVDPAAATEALRAALAPRERELIWEDEQLAALYTRLSVLEHALPPHLRPAGGWKSGTPPGQLIKDACEGATTVAEVKSRLRPLAEASLSYHDRQLLKEHAPESLTVPTGNQIRLDWTPAGIDPVRGPVLAVRLQEIFGWTDTPRVAGGTVPVVLHLLGPNYRPVQVTTDLRSFWTTTYFQVRKDLKARYPKHSWPEDPLTARPEAKGGRRRSSG